MIGCGVPAGAKNSLPSGGLDAWDGLRDGGHVRQVADAKAILDQRARNQIAHLAMVVDDQDVRAGIHTPNLVRAALFGAKNIVTISAG